MSNPDDQLPSLDAETLEDVTGGVTGSGSTSNSQIAGALQGLQSSIKDIASNRGGGNNTLSQLLPFLLFSKGGAGGGACPCGCGMANCMRR